MNNFVCAHKVYKTTIFQIIFSSFFKRLSSSEEVLLLFPLNSHEKVYFLFIHSNFASVQLIVLRRLLKALCNVLCSSILKFNFFTSTF